jgi:hypothetical protein
MDDQRKSEIRALGEKFKAAKAEQRRLFAIMASEFATAEDRAQAAADHASLVAALREAVADSTRGCEKCSGGRILRYQPASSDT